ncbi:MAG: hypothetical protein HYT80_04835, partial [Euryarchaeota archaeon]|nr:hypothetical protein [Euryarchaeota archaeon]
MAGPLEADPEGVAAVRGLIRNLGADGSEPTWAVLYAEIDGTRSRVASTFVPPVAGGDEFPVNFSFSPWPGLVNLTLVADDASTVAESDETNNQASSTLQVGPVDAEEEVVLGAASPGTTLRRSGASVVVRHAVDSPRPVVVPAAALEEMVTDPALVAGTFQETVVGGERRLEVHPNFDQDVETRFVPFDLKKWPDGLYGRGSQKSVRLLDRPMHVQLVELGQGSPESRGGLLLRLEDGNPQGQPVRLNKTWLASHGFLGLRAEHEDGTPIPVEETPYAFLLHPSHFSDLYLLRWSSLWELLHDQPESRVSFTPEATIRVETTGSDAMDETLITDLIPDAQFEISADILTDYSGDRIVYPLVLGNRHERTHPNPEDSGGIRRAFGFKVTPGQGWGPPRLSGFVWGNDTNWPVDLFDVVMPSRPVSLRINVGPASTLLQAVEADPWAPTILASETVANNDLPLAFVDSLLVATESESGAGWGGTYVGISTLKLVSTVGSTVNAGFADPANWLLGGIAQCCPAGGLALYDSSSTWNGDFVAQAAYNSTLSAPRFVMNFDYDTSYTPEGFAFTFYKEMGYTAAAGHKFALEDADASTAAGHRGYALIFETLDADTRGDSYYQLRLTKDTATNVLAQAHVNPVWNTVSQAPHRVRVEVTENRVAVYWDGVLALVHRGAVDRTYSGFGFTGETGSKCCGARITGMSLSIPTPPPTLPAFAPYPPSRGAPAADAVGQPLAPTRLSWVGGDPNGDNIEYLAKLGLEGGTLATVCAGLTTAASQPVCNVTGLAQDTRYCWTVQLAADTGVSPTPICFRTDRPPNATHTPGPVNGTTTAPAGGWFSWTSGGDPDGQPLTFTVLAGTSNPPLAASCIGSQWSQWVNGTLVPP